MLGGILMREKHPFGTTPLPCVRVREAILGYRRHARARKRVVLVDKHTLPCLIGAYERRYRETASRTLTHAVIVAASCNNYRARSSELAMRSTLGNPAQKKRMAAAFLAVPRRHPHHDDPEMRRRSWLRRL
jgi:hypothetical protein